MRNFHDTFETRKQSFISALSFWMTVSLREIWCEQENKSNNQVNLPNYTCKYEVRKGRKCGSV